MLGTTTEKNSKKKKRDLWPLHAILLTFALTVIFSFLSEIIMKDSALFVSISALFIIIAIGILFDILGTACASCDPLPFYAMASKKVRGAKAALIILKNASRVSNICCDIVGDMCGIVSGSATAIIVVYVLSINHSLNDYLFSMFLTATVASLTVGGKAISKKYAMRNGREIVHVIGKILAVFGAGK